MTTIAAPLPGIAGIYDGPASIAGTVLDDAGDGAHRVLVLMDAGRLTVIRRGESADDGSFSLPPVRAGHEVWLIVQDDAAGTTYNHKIARVMP